MDYKYMYKNINYVFELSRYAKVELEEMQRKKTEGLDMAKILSFQKLFDEQGNIKADMLPTDPQEQAKLASEIALYLDKLEDEDVYKVGYILLRNNKNYRDTMTKELFDEIVDDMEEKLGFEETYAFFKGVNDHVFTIINNLGAMNKTEKSRKKGAKKVIN